MTTTVTTHSSSIRRTRINTLASLTSVDSASMSPKTCTSLPSSPVSVTGMSGLLNSRHLVQDEKLVVATLATLNSGSASNLIKQDLKWIIQSRRKAEGKSELKVEFKKPVRDEQLTSEELLKRARRRELNRLAARRSREKGQKRKDMLVEEIRKLQSQNCELVNVLGDLTEQRNSIVVTLRQHMKQCSDYHATQNAAVGMSQRVLDLLGFSSVSAKDAQVQDVTDLYICTGDSSSSHSRSQSPSVIIKQEKYPYTSCPVLPVMVGIDDSLIEVHNSSVPCGIVVYDESSSNPNVFNMPCSQVSYSIPASSPEVESLPIAAPSVPRLSHQRSTTFCSEIYAESTSSTANEGPGDGEIHYKHKLMKHRKQSSEISEPSSSSSSYSRGARVCLERSFSFPSTMRDSRSSLDSSSPGSYLMELTQSDISNTISLPHTPATISALDSGSERDDIGSPLDLAVKKASSSFCDSREKQFMASPLDTWPPTGMRAAASSRSLERRWSVDDHQTLPPPEPLNLSSKDSIEEGHVLFTSNTNRSSSHRDSLYSGFFVDPYR